MQPIRAIGIGIALIGVYLMATSVVGLLSYPLGPFAPLVVGSVLFGIALWVLDRRQQGD